MLNSQNRFLTLISLIIILSITTLVYYPGLSGSFVHDDIGSIVANQDIQITEINFSNLQRAWFGEESGPLGRPLSAISFALNHAYAGLDPRAFKLTNLLIHLSNGLLIWFFLNYLLRELAATAIKTTLTAQNIQYFSLFVTAVWLLHPINLTNVLYAVQRMNSLAAFFSLLGLIFYLQARTTRQRYSVHPGWLLATLFATAAAALSKENGLLVPALALVIELTVFGGKTTGVRARYWLIGFFITTVLLPAISLIFWLIISPERFLIGYEFRNFSLADRIMTQGRAICFYINQLFFPRPGIFTLYHDGFSVSRGLLDPPTTLLAYIGLLFAVLISIYLRVRKPIISMGILFFLVGHSLESSILPLELVYEHRNYLPSLGLFLILGYLLFVELPGLIKPRLAWSIGIIFVLVCASLTTLRAVGWSSYPSFIMLQEKNQPDSPRANNEIGTRLYKQMAIKFPENKDLLYDLARKHFLRAVELQSNNTVSLINLIETASMLDKPIDIAWFNTLKQRLANEPLLPRSDSSLYELMECVFEERCDLQPEQVSILIDAALSNDRLRTIERANLLYAKSVYLVTMTDNMETAVALARQANELYPYPALRLHLVNLLIGLGDYDEAEIELAKVRESDHYGSLSEGIRSQVALLQKMRENPTAKLSAQ